MTISTKYFEALALAGAKGRHMPSLHNVILPFPLETAPAEEVRRVAHKAFDDVIQGLLEANRPLVEVER